MLRRGFHILPGAFREKLRGSAWRFGGIIDLGSGEPGFDVPDEVKRAAKEVLYKGVHYTPAEGLIELREAVAEKIKREHNLIYGPQEEITITYGASEALFVVFLALINPGDDVLLSDPSYFIYTSQVLLAGGRPKMFPLKEENEFRPMPEDIERLIGPRTKLLVINSPHNPTGAVLTRGDVKKIADICLENNLLVVWDEVYEKIAYDGVEHFIVAALPEMRKHSIMINSFSKTYAMTGWRVGYVYTDAELMKRIKDTHRKLVLSMNAAAQLGALAALRRAQNFISGSLHEYDKRRKLLVKGLNEIDGIRCLMSKGTFYAFPNISGLEESSKELANHLYEKASVATIPGVSFGPRGEGHLRLSFSRAHEGMLKEALSRIRKSLKI